MGLLLSTTNTVDSITTPNDFFYGGAASLQHYAAPSLSFQQTTDFNLINQLSETLLQNSIEPLEQYLLNRNRVIKQYRVEEEENQEENDLKLDFNFTAEGPPTALPYTLNAGPFTSSENVVVGPAGYLASQLNGKVVRSFLSSNHGPIALGSGSLGIIRHPLTNAIYLGSGSLGYISPQQHQNSLVDILKRHDRPHLPSPLHFGHQYD